ncbi:hypothetical protein [Marinobacterium rhizophilum]|uniref:Ig-like domain-containing protein n=1 Tax=Marinobacterium rhizophilum TaxID=420402 RepID=A0ABY5HPE2_9GAMM|nr:hypothetical protein [Marinobacterium rhizophilum]UTW12756.1 hypothetical protein KDW95_03500 [Marinobacterium rhizophilum]
MTNVNDAPTVTLSGTPTGTTCYQWLADAMARSATSGARCAGETGSSYALVDADVGKTITVRASYTDGFNTAEVVVSNALGPVTNVNDDPTGNVTLSGTPAENQTLSVTNSLADEDGLGTISYQWLRDGADITGETGSSYTLVDADVGASITVRASYTDGFNTAEVVVSNALGPVTNVNDAPSGSVTLSGTATENQTLTVSDDLADEDGLGTISYQWLRDGADITGETGNSYTLVDADVGASITVRASYTDGFNTAEVVVSNALGPVTNINDAPSGSVTLSGTPAENQTLTVSDDLADEDGLGTISYQWLRDGADITGETGNSYTLVDADVGASITVRASYTDGFNTAEVVVSNALGPVTNVNDAPTGAVTLSGTPTENQTLTVSNDLADEDGLGTISYQWLRDGVDITGETGNSYTLVDADVGKTITVRASYTDGFNTAEVVVSNALGPVTNVNDAPTGSVTLSGTATENQTLSVTNSLADEDGLGTISYQWLRDGADITGETGNSYTLVDADVGKTITVRASYTDGFNTAEVVVSNALGPVINVNDTPSGNVEIIGKLSMGELVQAAALISDDDGMGPLSYQWLRDGVAIPGATSGSYVLQAPDLGAQLGIRVSFIDGFGQLESLEAVVSVIAPPAVTAGVPGLGGIELFPEPDPSAPEGPGEFAGTEVEDDGVTDEEEVLENSTRTTVSVHAEDSGLRFALLNSSTLEGMVFQTPAEPDSDNTLVEKTNLYGYWKELDDSFAAMLSSGLITDLEGLEQQLKEHSGLENAILGGGLVISAGLSAGYVVWLLRSGVLLSSVMTSLPAWRFVDPLPVLAQTGNFGEEDSESLQSILDDHRNNSIDDAGSGAGKGQGVH